MSFKVGRVTHYYDKIGIAIIELDNSLVVGDTITLVNDGEDLFEQTVSSIQLEHEKIPAAQKGQTVGIKMQKEVPPGAVIFKTK